MKKTPAFEVITLKINNWEKYQPTRKDVFSSTWFKVSNRIMEDDKIKLLSPQTFVLLMTFFCHCSQKNNATISLVDRNLILSIPQLNRKRLASILHTLESLQILTIVSRNVHGKVDIYKEDTTEEYTTENILQSCNDLRKARKSRPQKESKSSKCWDTYLTCYRQHHSKDPAKPDARTRSMLCTLIDRYGEEPSVGLIRHYFTLPNAFYLKNFHPIAVLLKDSHAIYGSMTTGKIITKNQAQQLERSQETRNLMERIDNGEV